MDLIKQNLFLVVLVGVTIVLAGLILFVNSSVVADVEEVVSKRDRLSGRLRRFARGQEYNRDVINARRAEVDGSKQNLQAVVDRSQEFNNRYRVLSLVRPDGKGVVDAFPFNRDLDREIALRAVFPDAFDRAIRKLEGSLKSTSPPTGVIPPVELRQWRRRVLTEAKQEWAEAVQAGTIERTRTVNGETVSTEPVMNETMAAEALRRAATERMVRQAVAGEIYVDPLALQRLVEPTEKRPLLQTMWYAQLSLWLQKDVINAIQKTNDEEFAGLQAKQRTVPEAAVKRLIEIRMIPQYVGGTGELPGGTGNAATATGELTAASLTEAVSNRDFDVIHYTVTVVIPFRHLPRLQWHLMRENFHTVLDVVDVSEQTDPPYTYYYGAEPVVRVTLRGEWKLLTSWERPLVPREVLATLPSEALRQADSQRVGALQSTGGTGRSEEPRGPRYEDYNEDRR